MALGGADLAQPAGPLALYWNPAGLDGVRGWSIGVTGDLAWRTGHFIPSTPPAGYDTRTRSELADRGILGGSVVATWARERWTLGVGYVREEASSTAWDLYALPRDFNSELTYPEKDWVWSSRIDQLLVGAGIQLMPSLRMGVAVFFRRIHGSGHRVEAALADGLSLASSLPVDAGLDVAGAAPGFSAGLRWTPSAEWELGLHHRSGGKAEVSGLAPRTTYLSSAWVHRYAAPDRIHTLPRASGSVSVSHAWSVGVAHCPSPRARLLASLEYFTPGEYLEVAYSFPEDELALLEGVNLAPAERGDWPGADQASWRLALGAEWGLRHCSARGGVGFEGSAVRSASLSPLRPDLGVTPSLHLGAAGSGPGAVHWSVGASRVFSTSRPVALGQIDAASPPGQLEISGLALIFQLEWTWKE